MRPLITRGTDGDARVISQEDHRGKRRTIAHVYGPEQEKLTQLFIAAPDLLGAAQALIAECESMGRASHRNATIDRMVAAIAKAEGEEVTP